MQKVRRPSCDRRHYPLCEADDCYCKRHFPNRSGGREIEVFDNDKNTYMILCEHAISSTEIEICGICDRKMFTESVNAKLETKICASCFETYMPGYVRKQIKIHACNILDMLPDLLQELKMEINQENWETCTICSLQRPNLEEFESISDDIFQWNQLSSIDPKFMSFFNFFASWAHGQILEERASKKNRKAMRQIVASDRFKVLFSSLSNEEALKMSKRLRIKEVDMKLLNDGTVYEVLQWIQTNSYLL
jgi:hypothetical protein